MASPKLLWFADLQWWAELRYFTVFWGFFSFVSFWCIFFEDVCVLWPLFEAFCRILWCVKFGGIVWCCAAVPYFIILSFCSSLQHCQWAPSPCSCWHSRHFSLAKSAHWHQLIKYLWLLFFKPYFFFLVVFEQVLLRNHAGFRSFLCNIATVLKLYYYCYTNIITIIIQCRNIIWFISFWFTLFILHRLCPLGAVAFGIRSKIGFVIADEMKLMPICIKPWLDGHDGKQKSYGFLIFALLQTVAEENDGTELRLCTRGQQITPNIIKYIKYM